MNDDVELSINKNLSGEIAPTEMLQFDEYMSRKIAEMEMLRVEMHERCKALDAKYMRVFWIARPPSMKRVTHLICNDGSSDQMSQFICSLNRREVVGVDRFGEVFFDLDGAKPETIAEFRQFANRCVEVMLKNDFDAVYARLPQNHTADTDKDDGECKYKLWLSLLFEGTAAILFRERVQIASNPDVYTVQEGTPSGCSFWAASLARLDAMIELARSYIVDDTPSNESEFGNLLSALMSDYPREAQPTIPPRKRKPSPIHNATAEPPKEFCYEGRPCGPLCGTKTELGLALHNANGRSKKQYRNHLATQVTKGNVWARESASIPDAIELFFHGFPRFHEVEKRLTEWRDKHPPKASRKSTEADGSPRK